MAKITHITTTSGVYDRLLVSLGKEGEHQDLKAHLADHEHDMTAYLEQCVSFYEENHDFLRYLNERLDKLFQAREQPPQSVQNVGLSSLRRQAVV